MFLQFLLNGIIAGSAYSLIAIGYTMIYGVGRLINFAHGELYMGAAFAFYYCYIVLNLNLFLSFSLGMMVGGILGVVLERVAYRPFKECSRLVPLITTIGASTFLRALAAMLFGVETRTLLKGESFQYPLSFGGITLTPVQLVIIGSSLGLMTLLAVLLKKTRTGKALRATAQDRAAAHYVGIDTDRITSLTFAVGGLLAAVAGILVGYDQNISPTMGVLAGFKGFSAAVLGGIGSITGAVLGGFCLGLAENLGAGYIASVYKDSISIAILLLILLFRPQGLWGEK
jgi:branched-chain amino acid transport system permease protein